MGNIRKIIREAAATGDQIYSKVCRVAAVGQKSIDVEPVDGAAAIYDVPLQADTDGDGLLLVPKEGSYVTVVFTGKHTAMVCGVS
jgi:hypothetical protein